MAGGFAPRGHGERHPPERTSIEVDGAKPVFAELEQLELEDAAPSDQPE